MTLGLINTNHVVHAKKERVAHIEDFHADDVVDPLDIYDFVRDIRDPEHPYSLEQLSVLSEESIAVDDKLGRILRVSFLNFELQFCIFLDNFYADDSALQYGNSDRTYNRGVQSQRQGTSALASSSHLGVSAITWPSRCPEDIRIGACH
ncbi:protein AE7-like isoform X1 [Malus domestica]|uniref:protein AE7-like isoform X1 n=1 Tax=Malus domestica TaxID=3750 RepID=UPI0039750BD3